MCKIFPEIGMIRNKFYKESKAPKLSLGASLIRPIIMQSQAKVEFSPKRLDCKSLLSKPHHKRRARNPLLTQSMPTGYHLRHADTISDSLL
jgi:hypothetical protein